MLIRSLVAVVILAGVAHAEEPSSEERAASFDEHVRPFLKRYCFSCHSDRKTKAGIRLTAYTESSQIIKNRKVWEKVLKVLVHREMPPEGKRQPSEEDRARVSEWVNAELESFDCSGDVDPGRVTIRRLNRAEYNNSVSDLFGVRLTPAASFPADEVGYGFDNIGDVLSMPPLLLEKYLEAADAIVDEALTLELNAPGARRRYQAEGLQCTTDCRTVDGAFQGIYKTGETYLDVEFPVTGEYELRARAYAQQAGAEVARMAFRIDGKDVAVVDVEAEDDAPLVYSTRAHIEAGRRRFAMVYTNNYVNSNHPNPALRGDRNLFVDWFEAMPVGLPASGPQVIRCWPDSAADNQACAQEIVQSFARRAWRRPLTGDERSRLSELIATALKAGETFRDTVALALKAVLVSPHFVFRVEGAGEIENEVGDDNKLSLQLVGNYELASRLSYFLWSTMPDDELFLLAEEGRLQDPEVLEKQVARMLADDRASALVDNFAGQWLGIRKLAAASPDPERFADFDDALRDAMAKETSMFFASIARDNRSVLEFIDSDYTFVNARLAQHYGIDGVEGEEFRRVPTTEERGGVLTHASVLTLTSNPTRTSPVKRGLWVLEEILGEPPPPPPPDVPDLSEEPEAILSGSLRERMEKHREDPDCAQCHSLMDPIGFAFENFDAIGAWREFDGRFKIDPAGELPGGQRFAGPGGLKKILSGRADDFARSLTEKLLTYAVGRGLEYYDKCAIDAIADRTKESEYRFHSLVTGVVLSDPFRKRRVQVVVD